MFIQILGFNISWLLWSFLQEFLYQFQAAYLLINEKTNAENVIKKHHGTTMVNIFRNMIKVIESYAWKKGLLPSCL